MEQSSPQKSSLKPQKSSLNLEMPLGQGQDGKPFLNFGKRVWRGKREDEEERGGVENTCIHAYFNVNAG